MIQVKLEDIQKIPQWKTGNKVINILKYQNYTKEKNTKSHIKVKVKY